MRNERYKDLVYEYKRYKKEVKDAKSFRRWLADELSKPVEVEMEEEEKLNENRSV